jgi:hypothetical protein
LSSCLGSGIRAIASTLFSHIAKHFLTGKGKVTN